jgi:glycine/D-amino acid oxidase-like deaminating enzyme
MNANSAQIAVIGGGIIGAAITYYLAKAGADVVLVERGDVGSGSSTACSGAILMQTKGAGDKLKIAMESREMYQTLGVELGEDLEYEHEGGMIIAETPEELEYIKNLSMKLCEAGSDVRLLDKDEIKDKQPFLSECVIGSTFCPLDGSVNPLKVTFAFARAAKKAGARFYTFTCVNNIKVVNGKVCAVMTDRGAMIVETVINAAGVWAPEIGKMVGLEIPILPRRGILVVTEITSPMVRGSLISAKYLMSKYGKSHESSGGGVGTDIPGGLVIRHTKSGNFVFGSSREFVDFNRNTTWRGTIQIVQEAARILPGIRNVNVIRTFAGLRPYTHDGLPILGIVPYPQGFIMAAGHEGDGIALAPITGKMIADLVSSGESSAILKNLNIERFKR